MSAYDIRPYRPGDEQGILETFNVVFGENDPDFVPRTLKDWRWAFEENPAGQRIWVAERDGVIAAQCAALPYRVLIDGMKSSFTQGVDSMVHPEHRRGLRRPGLFVATAKPFFEQYGWPHGDILHYGWPVEPAWRIGKTFLGYEIIRTQLILFSGVPAGTTDIPSEVQAIERFDDSADELYARCQPHWGASIIRDAEYLNWRFVDNPKFTYQILGVRDDAGSLRGYVVFRKTDWPVPGTVLMMDWLVDHDDVEVGELLREAVMARSRAEGAEVIVVVFPEWSPWFPKFQEWGWRAQSKDYLLIGIIQTPKYDTWWLRDNWWYQLAELDLI